MRGLLQGRNDPRITGMSHAALVDHLRGDHYRPRGLLRQQPSTETGADHDSSQPDRRPPSDADLDTPGSQRSLAYDRAWWFARFVADTYGAATLRRLYQAACGVRHADVPVAVQDVLGVDTRDVVARWQQWFER